MVNSVPPLCLCVFLDSSLYDVFQSVTGILREFRDEFYCLLMCFFMGQFQELVEKDIYLVKAGHDLIYHILTLRCQNYAVAEIFIYVPAVCQTSQHLADAWTGYA